MKWEIFDYLIDNGVCEDVILTRIMYYEYHLQFKSIW